MRRTYPLKVIKWLINFAVVAVRVFLSDFFWATAYRFFRVVTPVFGDIFSVV
jgi:hypothetical protein